MKLKSVRLMLVIATLCFTARASADIMDVDVTRVAPQYRQAFLNAEKFWETRIVGYSNQLNRSVLSQLTKLRITAETAAIDGAGGVLGQAAPVNVLRFGAVVNPFSPGGNSQRGAIARTGLMTFDIEDIAGLAAAGALESVVRHEMAHAMGFGSLWGSVQQGNDNRLLSNAVNGQFNYVGKYGLAAYRQESGNTFSRFVPVEQGGGAGTALAHWEDDDPFFNRRAVNNKAELMLGSINPGVDVTFVSETTWAQFADLWYAVKGINVPGKTGGTPWTNRTGPPLFGRFGGGPLAQMSGGGAIPEPATGGVLLMLGAIFAGSFRRRAS